MRSRLLLGAIGCLLAPFPGAPGVAADEADVVPATVPGSNVAHEDWRAQAEVGKAEETTRALERALVRRGGLVLGPWSMELEPLMAYGYRESDGLRRDTFSSSLAFRLGLPWQAQGEVRVPFVLRDRQSGGGATSGLGDVGVGLTKLLLLERGWVPELLVTARWKTTTGSSDGRMPTGTGANGLQGLATAVKRDDPLVFVGTAYYVWNMPSDEVDLGDAIGAIAGVILAATPDTSVTLEVDIASFSATRIEGERLGGTDRLSGILDIGLSTVVGRKLLFNLTAGIGITPSAPDLQLAVAFPLRF